MPCAVTIAVLHQICRNRIEPRRESLACIKLCAVLVNTHKGLLRSVSRVFFVLQAANEVVEQLPGVTFHEFIQRSFMACNEPLHVGPVECVEFCGFAVHGFTLTEKLTLPLPRGPS